ncbi:hypothetical protein NC651_026233 [Populus alba x Populus x berolinensis]|nr:hypothetical protein NC651_026233 [Populus alba x Populus x berolinensis]
MDGVLHELFHRFHPTITRLYSKVRGYGLLSANNLKEINMASNQLSGVTPPSIVNMYAMVQILGLCDH